MTPIRIFALLLWAGLLLLAAQLGHSLASLPPTGAFELNLQGYVTLALPAFFFATAPLWMRGHPLDMQQIRKPVDARFTPGTYNRFVHTVRPLQLLAAFGAVTGSVFVMASGGMAVPAQRWGTGLFFLSAAVGFVICLLLLRVRGHRIE
jgi:hypothetical protein